MEVSATISKVLFWKMLHGRALPRLRPRLAAGRCHLTSLLRPGGEAAAPSRLYPPPPAAARPTTTTPPSAPSTPTAAATPPARVEEGDLVLEIGPGTGSLTAALLAAGATVVAVEKDKHVATLVKDRFGSTEQLKVVSNLPFNVSTEVVKQILSMGDVFSVMVLMLQDETVLCLANASIQIPEYRPINVFVIFYSEPEYKFKVERANFFPQPKVDGAVISFKLKNAGEYPSVGSNKSFFSMVNSAFNGKRKMLRKSLQHICSSAEIEAALTNIGLPATARPSDLMMDDFVRLHNHLAKV